MKQLKGKTVLITGGASGIGKLMGRIVLEKGAYLIIWDINSKTLEETKSEFAALGNVACYLVDISDPEQVSTSALEVKSAHGTVDVLINNAGIITGKYFHEHSAAEIAGTMDLNANAPMFVTLEFINEMLEQDSGHICNIASSAGLISNIRMSVYVASKWALTGWSDSLRLEMKQLKKNIHVTTVTPYYISTGMFKGVSSLIPILKPEKVAQKIISAIEKEKIFLSMPWSVRFVRLSQGLFPVWFYDWFVGDVLGVYKSMDSFKGRGEKQEKLND